MHEIDVGFLRQLQIDIGLLGIFQTGFGGRHLERAADAQTLRDEAAFRIRRRL